MEDNSNIIEKGGGTGCDVHLGITTTNTSNCNEQKQELDVPIQDNAKDISKFINDGKNIFSMVQSKIPSIIPHIIEDKIYIEFMPTECILSFASAFLGEKFNYKEIGNGKSDSKITKNDINGYKNKSVLINGSGHASALFVGETGKAYSFDTYGTHQYEDGKDGTRVNKSICTINGAIAIEPDNRLQGDTAACTIWTICALLEVSKYGNIEEALDSESIDENIDEKKPTRRFKPCVLNNIIKLVSCIECGTYEQFNEFIKLNKEVDIDYTIPEKSKLISNETKKMVSEYDTQHKVKKIIPPIMSQSTIENVPTDSMSTSTPRIYSEPNSTTPSRSSTPPPR